MSLSGEGARPGKIVTRTKQQLITQSRRRFSVTRRNQLKLFRKTFGQNPSEKPSPKRKGKGKGKDSVLTSRIAVEDCSVGLIERDALDYHAANTVLQSKKVDGLFDFDAAHGASPIYLRHHAPVGAKHPDWEIRLATR